MTRAKSDSHPEDTRRIHAHQLHELVAKTVHRTYAKPAPVLVLPKKHRTPPPLPVVAKPVAAPPIILPPVAAEPIAPPPVAAPPIALPPVAAPEIVPSPVVVLAPPANDPVLEHAHVIEVDVDLSRVQPTARARRREVVDFEANVLRRGWFKRRLRAILVIALVVVARPWWWNIGDARVARAAHGIGDELAARAATVATIRQ